MLIKERKYWKIGLGALISFCCFCFLSLIGIGEALADDSSVWKTEIPALQSIKALDASGEELHLKNGSQLDIDYYPGYTSNSKTSDFKIGYLIVPDGTAKLSFSFLSQPQDNKNYITYPTIRRYYKDAWENNFNTSEDNLTLDIDIEDLGIDAKIFSNSSNEDRVNIYYSYKPTRPVRSFGCHFRIVSESNPNVFLKDGRSDALTQQIGDILNVTPYGNECENNDIDLYYSYTENGEVKEKLYKKNLEKDTVIDIPLDSSELQFGDVLENNSGKYFYYQLNFYTKIGDFTSNLVTVNVEDNSVAIFDFIVSQYTGSYSQVKQWVNLGVDFTSRVSSESEVEVYLSSLEDGAEVMEGTNVLKTTVADMPSSVNMKVLEAGMGLEIPAGLNPGQYYLVLKLTEENTEENIISYKSIPFNIYEDAQAYIKASLDQLIEWYITNTNGGFINRSGIYVGLSEATGSGSDGRSWESWMFPALGDDYDFDDAKEYGYLFQSEGAKVADIADGKISFSVDGPILSNQNNASNRLTLIQSGTETYQNVGPKDLFRIITSSCAVGADPRDLNEAHANLVEELISWAYVTRDVSKGELQLNEDGALSIPSDIWATSYFLLVAEMVEATPEEGYTDELRRAGIKAILPIIETFANGEGNSTPDLYGMISLALYFMTDDEVYGERIKEATVKMADVVKNNLYANGGIGSFNPAGDRGKFAINVNSMAMMLNALVLFDTDVEDLDTWQSKYGSVLTAFVACQDKTGAISFNGTINYMSTYQYLGALVDLYNGKSCFVVAHENYLEKYPQYNDDSNSSIEDKPINIEIEQVKDFVNSKEAKLSLKATNEGEENVSPNLITGLYEIVSDVVEMVQYNYVNVEMESEQSMSWGSAFAVPSEGEFKIKAFSWDNMDIPNSLSEVKEFLMEDKE